MMWLRSALFNAWFYGLTFVFAIGGIGVRAFAPERGLEYARFWSGLVLGGLRRLCGIEWRVTGLEHLPKDGPALIASMHQSAFDTLVWQVVAPRFTFVLKRELTRIPLFGPMLRTTGMIAVDRGAGAAAIRELLRRGAHAVATGRQIIIFPHGTRMAPGDPGVLHPGVAALAAHTGLPVIPVATDSGRCWGRRAFRKHPGTIHVAIQPPIAAGLGRADLMARLADAFARGGAELTSPVDMSVNTATPALRARAR
jgi:1-acyl-sn-glycerol-3-phosphate acyltransferase